MVKKLTNLEVIEDTVRQHPTWSPKAVHSYVRKARKRKVSMERVKMVHTRILQSMSAGGEDDEGDENYTEEEIIDSGNDDVSRVIRLLDAVKEFGTLKEAIGVLQAIAEE